MCVCVCVCISVHVSACLCIKYYHICMHMCSYFCATILKICSLSQLGREELPQILQVQLLQHTQSRHWSSKQRKKKQVKFHPFTFSFRSLINCIERLTQVGTDISSTTLRRFLRDRVDHECTFQTLKMSFAAKTVKLLRLHIKWPKSMSLHKDFSDLQHWHIILAACKVCFTSI